MSRRFELVRLLDEYAAGPDEVRARAEMELAAHDPADVLSAYTFDPGHFTVSAFVTGLERASLVMVHHGRVGAWLQPGGHIEPGDATLEAALLRELEEETGLTDFVEAPGGLFDIDVHRVPSRRTEPAHRHFDLRFHLRARQRILSPADGGDEVAWVPLADVAQWTEDRSVLRSVRKLLGVGG